MLSTEVGRELHTLLMCAAGPREPGQRGVGWWHPMARREWVHGLGVHRCCGCVCGGSHCNLGIPGAAGEGSKATPTPAPRSPQPLDVPCQPPAPRTHLPSPCKPSPQPLASSQNTCSPQPTPSLSALQNPEPFADSSSLQSGGREGKEARLLILGNPPASVRDPTGSVHPTQPPRPRAPLCKPPVPAPRASLRSRAPLHLRAPPARIPPHPPPHSPFGRRWRCRRGAPPSGGGGGDAGCKAAARAGGAHSGAGGGGCGRCGRPIPARERGRGTPWPLHGAGGWAGGQSAGGEGPRGFERFLRSPSGVLPAVHPSVPPRRGQRPDPRAGGSRRFRERGAGAGGSRRRLGAALRPPRP